MNFDDNDLEKKAEGISLSQDAAEEKVSLNAAEERKSLNAAEIKKGQSVAVIGADHKAKALKALFPEALYIRDQRVVADIINESGKRCIVTAKVPWGDFEVKQYLHYKHSLLFRDIEKRTEYVEGLVEALGLKNTKVKKLDQAQQFLLGVAAAFRPGYEMVIAEADALRFSEEAVLNTLKNFFKNKCAAVFMLTCSKLALAFETVYAIKDDKLVKADCYESAGVCKVSRKRAQGLINPDLREALRVAAKRFTALEVSYKQLF